MTNSELNQIEEYWKSGIIEIVKTDVLDTELLNDLSDKRKAKVSKIPEDIGILVFDHSRLGHTKLASDEEIKQFHEIIKLLFVVPRAKLSKQQIRDAMHLHTHMI